MKATPPRYVIETEIGPGVAEKVATLNVPAYGTVTGIPFAVTENRVDALKGESG